MRRTHVLFAILLAFPALLAAAPPAASPENAAAAPQRCGERVDADSEDPLSAYGHDLTDGPTLRTIDAIASLSAERQEKAASAIPATGASDDLTPALTSAVAAACAPRDVASAAARLALRVGRTWQPDLTGEHGTALETLTTRAVAAVRARKYLPAEAVAAALKPFGLAPADVDPPAPGPTTSACVEPDADAATLVTAPMAYPGAAAEERLTGVIRVRIDLNDNGRVQNASVYDVAVGAHPRLDSDPGVHALAEEAVLVAGSSTYAPLRRACRGSETRVLFNASFMTKP